MQWKSNPILHKNLHYIWNESSYFVEYDSQTDTYFKTSWFGYAHEEKLRFIQREE